MKKRVAIIGAGYIGLASAFELGEEFDVTIFESSDQPGGLARGFKKDSWDWYLDDFYHHLFVSDNSIYGLAKKLNIEDKLKVYSPSTSFLIKGKTYRFDKPQYIFNLPGVSVFSAVRMGLGLLKIKIISNWRPLESQTAENWLIRNFGKNVYEKIWKPLMTGKFGEYYDSVNMAWLWARIKKRSQKLLYPDGGFQAFSNSIWEKLSNSGIDFQFNCQIKTISKEHDDNFKLTTDTTEFIFDYVICTLSPSLFLKIISGLPIPYIDKIGKLKSIAAVIVIFILKKPLMDKTYWLNIPAKSPNPLENDIPFLACVEHTNMVPKANYNNEHIVYCCNYIKPEHELMRYSDEDLINLYKRGLKKVNENFDDSDILSVIINKTNYAAPVFFTNHSKNVPDIKTPIKNLYWASMSHVYPWDRGTNFAVDLGTKVARQLKDNREL